MDVWRPDRRPGKKSGKRHSKCYRLIGIFSMGWFRPLRIPGFKEPIRVLVKINNSLSLSLSTHTHTHCQDKQLSLALSLYTHARTHARKHIVFPFLLEIQMVQASDFKDCYLFFSFYSKDLLHFASNSWSCTDVFQKGVGMQVFKSLLTQNVH